MKQLGLKAVILTTFISLCSGSLWCGSASSDEIYSFMNSKLGASFSDIENNFLVETYGGKETYLNCKYNYVVDVTEKICMIFQKRSKSSAPINVGGEKAESGFYHFVKKDNSDRFQLSRVSFKLNTISFDILSALLTKKYGEATEEKISNAQNRMGAQFRNKRCKWENEGSIISIEERSVNVDTMSLSYMHKKLSKLSMDAYKKQKSGDLDKL